MKTPHPTKQKWCPTLKFMRGFDHVALESTNDPETVDGSCH